MSAETIPAAAAPAGPVAFPLIVGHRGYPSRAPENTLPGITAAAAAGADVVEVDVRWSKGDGTDAYPGWPVLMHNDTVDATTPGTGRVDQLGLTALQKLGAADYAPWNQAGADPALAAARVPYAYDFLAAADRAGVTLLLDVQVTPTAAAARKLLEYINRFPGLAGRIIYMSKPASINAMRAVTPPGQLRWAMIEYNPAGLLRTGEYLADLGVEAYFVPARDVTADRVTYWRGHVPLVGAWSSDTPAIDTAATWDRLCDAGVGWLITDRIADAVAWRTARAAVMQGPEGTGCG